MVGSGNRLGVSAVTPSVGFGSQADSLPQFSRRAASERKAEVTMHSGQTVAVRPRAVAPSPVSNVRYRWMECVN
jgi:hypothetical protein